jgi:hypothetical protein
MDATERQRLLHELAQGIDRRGLTTLARITLDMIAPLGFLAGQAALFARPLLPSTYWRKYAAALADESAWRELRDLMDR